MKALEFESRLEADSSLRVPDALAAQIPREESIRVIVLLPESVDEIEWRRLTDEQFLSGYSDSDCVYDAV